MTAERGAVAAQLTHRLTSAGIPLDQTGLTPLSQGADNLVFAARTIDGRALVVKTPLRQPARYGTAAWAGRALAREQIPAPQVLWCDEAACVETLCPGVPLTGSADRLDTSGDTPHPLVIRAVEGAGALLRRAHDIAVRGFGKLNALGVGQAGSLAESLLHGVGRASRSEETSGLASAARRLLADNLWRLRDRGPRLLLGDCAARHIFADPATGTVTGFIDLESARGGDPHADVAGFSVREHPQVAQALLDGYFPDGPSVDQSWALTLHRARISSFLLQFHTHRDEHDVAQRIADILSADLKAITTETPTPLPDAFT
ncbi:aminoglycoside phosphotransferase family protein [Nonomuraea sp. NPDC026600]|uniref:phosphotransferase family protein n=1 Tax=Nonomuraea sp. NPDC026600 TaxID=3155363 RepID=UPI0033F5D442